MSLLESLPTPQEMVHHLDRFVRGQSRAKRDLALAFYDHYLGLAAASRPELGRGHVPRARQHVLVLGPTGCGKTMLVRTLCEWLGVPVAFWSATSMTESGYVGDDVDEPLKHLWRTARDPAMVHRGVVVLDEIDKIRAAGSGHRDVSGEGVQNGLLTLLDGRTVQLRDRQEALGAVDTSKLLFVCMGAFGGLPKRVRERLRGEAALGFTARGRDRDVAVPDDAAFAQATTADLVAYGLLPEFVGRFPTVTAVHSLDEHDLVALLEEQEGSALERERAMWRLHGIELRVEGEALRAIAHRALGRGTGARGLAFELRRSLNAIAWRRTEYAEAGVQRVVVGAAALLDGAEPTLERVARPRAHPPSHRLRAIAFGGRDPRAPRSDPRRRRRLGGQQDLGIGDAGDAAREPAMRERLQQLRTHVIHCDHAPPEARAWWERFEQQWPLATVVAAAEELGRLRATMHELWLAPRETGVLGIRANLAWLAYQSERRECLHALVLQPLIDARERRDARERGEAPPEHDAIDPELLPPLEP